MTETPALHTEILHVMTDDEPHNWTWELSVTPVTRWRMARILLADAAHDWLCPVTDWLGERPSRIAH